MIYNTVNFNDLRELPAEEVDVNDYLLINNAGNPQIGHGAVYKLQLKNLFSDSFRGGIGATGPAGATGASGFSGPRGNTGIAGPQGATGATGIGAVGQMGATGSTGVPGLRGATGLRGYSGATGPSGLIGPIGATGATGVQGATGATGVQGATGIQGATGLGATGATGVQGVGVQLSKVTRSENDFTISPNVQDTNGVIIVQGDPDTIIECTGAGVSSDNINYYVSVHVSPSTDWKENDMIFFTQLGDGTVRIAAENGFNLINSDDRAHATYSRGSIIGLLFLGPDSAIVFGDRHIAEIT